MLVVSPDRSFLDNVATSTLVFEPAGDTRRKRSFNEPRELAFLPALIETLETELAALHTAMATAD